MLYYTFFLVFGHFLSALVIYLNHRFIMHGKLKRYRLFKGIAEIHGKHHSHAYRGSDPYLFMPMWVQVILTCLILLISIINPALALGIVSFCVLYMYRHWAIHNHDTYSRFYRHHHHHHVKDPNSNFSGAYPFIDVIFRTKEE